MKQVIIFLLAIIIFIPSIAQTDSIIDPNASSYDSKESKITLVNQIAILTKQITNGFTTIDSQEDSLYLHKTQSLKIDKDVQMIKNEYNNLSKNIDKLELFLAIVDEHPDYNQDEIAEIKENLLFFQKLFERRSKEFLKEFKQKNPRLN